MYILCLTNKRFQSENHKHYNWQLVNDIKGLSKDDSSSQIDPETNELKWVNHFSNLHSSIDEFTKHARTANYTY